MGEKLPGVSPTTSAASNEPRPAALIFHRRHPDHGGDRSSVMAGVEEAKETERFLAAPQVEDLYVFSSGKLS
jgi:hypothetical protein